MEQGHTVKHIASHIKAKSNSLANNNMIKKRSRIIQAREMLNI